MKSFRLLKGKVCWSRGFKNLMELKEESKYQLIIGYIRVKICRMVRVEKRIFIFQSSDFVCRSNFFFTTNCSRVHKKGRFDVTEVHFNSVKLLTFQISGI